jgi:hypothetical protein
MHAQFCKQDYLNIDLTVLGTSSIGGRNGLAYRLQPLNRCPGESVLSLIELAKLEAIILLSGFCAVIFWNLLTGGILLQDLLKGDRRDGSIYNSPGRTQLLLLTLFPALYYLAQVIQNPQVFPQVPNALVAAVVASHVTYLGGKASAMLRFPWETK